MPGHFSLSNLLSHSYIGCSKCLVLLQRKRTIYSYCCKTCYIIYVKCGFSTRKKAGINAYLFDFFFLWPRWKISLEFILYRNRVVMLYKKQKRMPDFHKIKTKIAGDLSELIKIWPNWWSCLSPRMHIPWLFIAIESLNIFGQIKVVGIFTREPVVLRVYTSLRCCFLFYVNDIVLFNTCLAIIFFCVIQSCLKVWKFEKFETTKLENPINIKPFGEVSQ